MMTQQMFKINLQTPHTDLLKQQTVIVDTLSAAFSNMMTTSKSPTTDYQQQQDSSREGFPVNCCPGPREPRISCVRSFTVLPKCLFPIPTVATLPSDSLFPIH